MLTISLAEGGVAELQRRCPEVLDDFNRFHQAGVNLQVNWACFGATCWWCSTPEAHQEKVAEGAIVFSPYELAKLQYRWTDWVEYAVFTVKVADARLAVDWGQHGLFTTRQEGVVPIPQGLEEYLAQIQQTPARYEWWTTCVTHHAKYRAEIAEWLKTQDIDRLASLGKTMPVGQCPECCADQRVTSRGYECRAGHVHTQPHIPF